MLVGSVQSDVLTGIWSFPGDTWETIGPIFRNANPTWEWVFMDDLPEGAAIGWYRLNGEWFDEDAFAKAAKVADK